MLLIIGSGGLLGRHAEAYFRSMRVPVMAASHRAGADFVLDLDRGIEGLRAALPAEITHALICSSMTNIDRCYRNREESAHFNVTQTIRLLDGLMERGIKPIFCSSDLVFEGTSGNYREDDQRHPTTEYGRQKKTVEDHLLGSNSPALIIRMSKLYGLEEDDPSPVGQISRSLALGRPIRSADDQVVCPTWVVDIPAVVHRLIDSSATGPFHVTAPVKYTRYELAMLIARRMRLEHLVERCSIRDFDFPEPRPANNSLDGTRLQTVFSYRFTGIAELLEPSYEQTRSRIV